MEHGLTIEELDQRKEDAQRRFTRAVWFVGFSLGALTVAWAVLIVYLTHWIIEKI